jgi:hypothetical protein
MGITRSDYVRSMAFQSTTKLLPSLRWVIGSLLFVANKFGDLSLQQLKSLEVTDRLPPALVRVNPINEAQLRHISIKLGKTDLDPSGDKTNHILVGSVATTDPIYQLPLESDFEGGREV